jgi:hypothetical protein
VYYPGFLPVHECLLALPSVRDLWMTYLGGASDDYSALFDTLADDLSIMPALESISFNNCQTDVALLPMVNMLTTRTIDTEGVAKLKSFKLNFSQEDKHEAALDLKQQQTEVELAVDRLRMLRSEGLNVEIQSDFKWFSGNINSQMVLLFICFMRRPLKFPTDQRDRCLIIILTRSLFCSVLFNILSILFRSTASAFARDRHS